MTKTRAFFIAAIGVLTAGFVAAAPAAAGSLVIAKAKVGADQTPYLRQATDRGSWVEPRTRWKHEDYERRGYDRRGYDRRGYDRGYGRYYGGDDGYRRHFKHKKRKIFRRGFKRGYDDGYYDGRRHSRFKRRHRHDDYGFRGGFYFGDGYRGGSSFRFRY